MIMRSARQFTLIDHRCDDEFWATEYLVVEVVASKFPGTIEGGLDRHYGFNLLESALAQSAREEVNEGTYWGIGTGCNNKTSKTSK